MATDGPRWNGLCGNQHKSQKCARRAFHAQHTARLVDITCNVRQAGFDAHFAYILSCGMWPGTMERNHCRVLGTRWGDTPRCVKHAVGWFILIGVGAPFRFFDRPLGLWVQTHLTLWFVGYQIIRRPGQGLLSNGLKKCSWGGTATVAAHDPAA